MALERQEPVEEMNVEWLRAHVEGITRHDPPLLVQLSPRLRQVTGFGFDDMSWKKHGSYFAHNLVELYAKCYSVRHREGRLAAGTMIVLCFELMRNSCDVSLPWMDLNFSGDPIDELTLVPSGNAMCQANPPRQETASAEELLRVLCEEYIQGFEHLFDAKDARIAVASIFRCVQIAAAMVYVIMGARQKALGTE